MYRPDLLEGDFHPRLDAYYYRQWDGFRMPYHTHDQAEIMYVMSGGCEVHTERESIAMRKGEFIVLDAGVAHRLLVEEHQPCRMLNIEFAFTRQKSGFPSLRELAEGDPALSAFLQAAQPVLVLRDSSDVQHTLRSLVLQLDNPEPGCDLMVRLLFSQLLLQVARLAAEARECAQGTGEPYVRQAIRYMQQHYDCGLQVKDVAAAVSVHPGYLHRIFKRQIGVTVLEYLTSYRMEKAKMLLAKDDVPISDIAEYVGLNSRQYFSAVFKKHTGQTPQQYRSRVRTTSRREAGS